MSPNYRTLSVRSMKEENAILYNSAEYMYKLASHRYAVALESYEPVVISDIPKTVVISDVPKPSPSLYAYIFGGA